MARRKGPAVGINFFSLFFRHRHFHHPICAPRCGTNQKEKGRKSLEDEAYRLQARQNGRGRIMSPKCFSLHHRGTAYQNGCFSDSSDALVQNINRMSKKAQGIIPSHLIFFFVFVLVLLNLITNATQRTSFSPMLSAALSRSSASHDSLSSKSAQGTKRKRSRRRVSLKADVAVVPIPRREEYSDCTRERLWSSATELYQNAARNAVEFASEGWNWRNVTEDEDMLVHDVSGELIHPVHLKNVLQMNAESQEPPLRIPLRPNRPGASLSDLTGKGQVHVASTSIQPQQPPNLSPA
mmetsp:Transcript_21875/g.64576  ORF Transcript_21875/g.64576 Transcript_21875/m.64576 type:complete len:295 (-) Transcript_21875:750-1634(-)